MTISSSDRGGALPIFSAESTISITNGQVLAEPEDARRMDAGVRAEALDPAQHGRAGEPFLADPDGHRLVEREPEPRVGLADEDSQQLALTLDLQQIALPATTPA